MAFTIQIMDIGRRFNLAGSSYQTISQVDLQFTYLKIYNRLKKEAHKTSFLDFSYTRES